MPRRPRHRIENRPEKHARVSPEEREICKQIVAKGDNYLRAELGWNVNKVKGFMRRKGVQEVIAQLRELYSNREAVQQRQMFFAQAEINRLLPTAVRTIASALLGNHTNKEGREFDPPTEQQYRAAVEVVNRAGVGSFKWAEDDTPQIDARQVHLNIGGPKASDLDKTTSREKIRKALESVLYKVGGPIIDASTGQIKHNHKRKRKKARVSSSEASQAAD